MPIRKSKKDNLFVHGRRPIKNIIKGSNTNTILIGYSSIITIPTIDGNYAENVKLNIAYIDENKTEIIDVFVNSPEKKIWIKNKCKLSLKYNKKIYNQQIMEIKLMNGNQEIIENEIIQSINISTSINIKDITPSPKYNYSYNNANNTCSITGVTNKNIQIANDIEPYIWYNNKVYTLTFIGHGAFSDCSKLTSVTIPEGVETIGTETFRGCKNLTNIVIPSSVTNIGMYAFDECSSLISVNIPEGVTSIEDYTFSHCSNLTSIVIPSSVTNINHYAFNLCSSLSSIEIDPNNTVYKSDGNCMLTKDGKKLLLGSNNSIIPEGVISIGNDAFDYRMNLISIVIPEGVTSIGGNAFRYCSRLKSINIPSSVTSIGDTAFYWCKSLRSIHIPLSVTYIGWYAFDECNNLTIKCEASSRPSTWDLNWNPACPVVWGYTPTA